MSVKVIGRIPVQELNKRVIRSRKVRFSKSLTTNFGDLFKKAVNTKRG